MVLLGQTEPENQQQYVHFLEVDLDKLDGVRDRKDSMDSVSFLYSGDIHDLLQVLSVCQLSDLTITEPDLEEIFLHYYEKDGDTV